MNLNAEKNGWKIKFEAFNGGIYNVYIEGKDFKCNEKIFNSWESFIHRKYVPDEVKEYFETCMETARQQSKYLYQKEIAENQEKTLEKQKKVEKSMKDFAPIMRRISERFEIYDDDYNGVYIYDKKLKVEFYLDDLSY